MTLLPSPSISICLRNHNVFQQYSKFRSIYSTFFYCSIWVLCNSIYICTVTAHSVNVLTTSPPTGHPLPLWKKKSCMLHAGSQQLSSLFISPHSVSMLAAYAYRHAYTQRHTPVLKYRTPVWHTSWVHTLYSRASDNQRTVCWVSVWQAGSVGVNVPYGDVLFSELYGREEEKKKREIIW